MEISQIYDLIDLERYPINDLAGEAGLRLIKETQAALEQDGSCSLRGFVHAAIIAEMAAEAATLQHLAYSGPTEVTPYFFNYDLGRGAEIPDDHPLKRKGKRNQAAPATTSSTCCRAPWMSCTAATATTQSP